MSPAVKEVENSTDPVLLEILKHLTESTGRKQIPTHLARLPTPWNPDGKLDAQRPRFSRNSFLNGHRLRERLNTDAEITKFNQLKPGHYNGGKWVVIGTVGDQEPSISLTIPNRTVEDRLNLREAAGRRGLEGILDLILEEQAQVKL